MNEDEILGETKRIIDAAANSAGFEDLLLLLLQFSNMANVFKKYTEEQTELGTDWVDEACMVLFNRFFGD